MIEKIHRWQYLGSLPGKLPVHHLAEWRGLDRELRGVNIITTLLTELDKRGEEIERTRDALEKIIQSDEGLGLQSENSKLARQALKAADG